MEGTRDDQFPLRCLVEEARPTGTQGGHHGLANLTSAAGWDL